jgi:hypothetical protein
MAGTRAGAIRVEQRQCQSLMRMRKGVSQQQEHVNGVNANQGSRQTNLTGHAEGCACLSEEERSEIRQTDLTGHTEGHVCLSEKRRSKKTAG